ncbi:F-box only protein, partial [Ooceraea biroi]
DLTYIYYGKELLPYVRHHYLKTVWEEFMNRPIEQQLFEEIITFVTQWFHPEKDIFYSDIEKELDQIAQDVMEYLEIENFRHPIFKISQKQFLFWKRNDLDQDQWDNCDARQILDILVKIFFHELKYHEIILSGTVNIIRNYLIEKSVYIVQVAILFQSIARRLGNIRCDLLCFPKLDLLSEKYWLLKWKPKYG